MEQSTGTELVPMTATEVRMRRQEADENSKAQALMCQPLIDREIAILTKRGMAPSLPSGATGARVYGAVHHGTFYPAAVADAADELALRPPPEHADKPLHWIVRTGVPPLVACWSAWKDGWQHHGSEQKNTPQYMAEFGYRYLGPAEWRAPRPGVSLYPDPFVDGLKARIAELEENARWNTQQFDAFQDDNQAKFARICELENEIALLNAAVAHTEPAATDPIGPNDEAHRSVEETIGHIVNGRVIPSARAKVRAALDKADAPITGREARDAALGRALRLG